MTPTDTSSAEAGRTDRDDAASRGRIDWFDPAVPAGDAPPTVPRWPVGVAAALWAGWVLFLLLMVMQRIGDASV